VSPRETFEASLEALRRDRSTRAYVVKALDELRAALLRIVAPP